jgi:hypothetical protein
MEMMEIVTRGDLEQELDKLKNTILEWKDSKNVKTLVFAIRKLKRHMSQDGSTLITVIKMKYIYKKYGIFIIKTCWKKHYFVHKHKKKNYIF